MRAGRSTPGLAPGNGQTARVRLPVDRNAPGALYVERLGIQRRGWGLFAFALTVTALAIHPVLVPFVAFAWCAAVVRFSNTHIRIEPDRICVGRRSLPLAALDLSTLGRGRNPWPWRHLSHRFLVASPVWTRDSVGVRGRLDGRKVFVSVGTNHREELIEVLTTAVEAAKSFGPWGPPHLVPLPGWYADPWFNGGMRWWDGRAWTGFVARPKGSS